MIDIIEHVHCASIPYVAVQGIAFCLLTDVGDVNRDNEDGYD